MENKKGEVQMISEQNNAVNIDGVWYTLGSKVKMNYIRKGSVEYRTEETEEGLNDFVVFIKSAGQSNQSSVPVGNTTQGKPKAIEDSNTHRMSALKFAGNVYMNTSQEIDAKRLAEEAYSYLETGVWRSQ